MVEQEAKNFGYVFNAVRGRLTRSQASLFIQVLTSGTTQDTHFPNLPSNILNVFERKIKQHIRRNQILSLKEVHCILNMIEKMKFSKNENAQINSIKTKILKIYNSLIKSKSVKNRKKNKSKSKMQLNSSLQENLFGTSELLSTVEENAQRENFNGNSEICASLNTKTNGSEIFNTLNIGNMEIIFMGDNDQLSPSDLPFELLTNTNFETVDNSASVSNNQQCELFAQTSNDIIENRSSTPVLTKLQQTKETEPGLKTSLLTPSAPIECTSKETDNADISLRTLDDTLSQLDLSMNCSNTQSVTQSEEAQATLPPYPINRNIMKIDNSPTNCLIYNKENIESYSSIIEESEIDQGDNRLVKTVVSNKDNIKVSSKFVTDKNPEIIIEETQSSSEGFTLNTQPGTLSKFNEPQSPSLLNYTSNPRSLRISPSPEKIGRCMVFPQYEERNVNNSRPKINLGKLRKLGNKTTLTEETNKDTENIILVNESIRKSDDKLFSQISQCTDSDQIEVLMHRQRNLEKKIIETRKRYEAIWATKSIDEKVSAKFAKKFHVRIFDEPVEALINIQYMPNFKNHKFPLVTLKNVHEQFKASQLPGQALGELLNKVVNNLTVENTEDGHQTTESDSDSDTSDEDNKENREWLKEHYFKRIKNSVNVRDEEVYNDCKNKNPGAESSDGIGPSCDQREINEALENILRNMSID